jgi:hypothetical protein
MYGMSRLVSGMAIQISILALHHHTNLNTDQAKWQDGSTLLPLKE